MQKLLNKNVSIQNSHPVFALAILQYAKISKIT